MGIAMGKTKIDGRGRVTLPRELRRTMDLSPGDDVIVEETGEGLLLRPALSKREVFERLRGCITKASAVEAVDPMSLKRLLRAGD